MLGDLPEVAAGSKVGTQTRVSGTLVSPHLGCLGETRALAWGLRLRAQRSRAPSPRPHSGVLVGAEWTEIHVSPKAPQMGKSPPLCPRPGLS